MRGEHGPVVDELRQRGWRPLRTLLADARSAAASPDADAVEPYRWLLARVGEGIRLTQAGYLPPAVVGETMRALGLDARWIGAMNREDQTYPVLELRDVARRTGLLRVHRGVLLRTATGRELTEDPVGLWWHLADRLPVSRGRLQQEAGVLFLLAVAAGQRRPTALVADGLAALGVQETKTHMPPSRADALDLARDTWAVFHQLGLLPEGSQEQAPSAGAVALARAALFGREAAEPVSLPVAGPQTVVELTVTLRDVEPPVWRRLVVPTSLSLWQLHGVIQTAMGWEDAHLHLFDIGGVRYGDVEDIPGELGDEDGTTVGDAVAGIEHFTYQYDFGDRWEHDIRVGARLESVGHAVPHCVDGARACPPEDCGGAPGYEDLLRVLGDPADPDRAELLEWLGGGFNPEAFDRDAVNRTLES